MLAEMFWPELLGLFGHHGNGFASLGDAFTKLEAASDALPIAPGTAGTYPCCISLHSLLLPHPSLQHPSFLKSLHAGHVTELPQLGDTKPATMFCLGDRYLWQT